MSTPPPPDAQSFLAAIERRAFEKPEFIIGNLSHLIAKPAEITRGWRALSLMFLPACFALMGILVAGIVNFERIRTDRAWRNLYLNRESFHRAAYVYLERVEELKEREDVAKDLQLARAYLASHFADVITNQAFWSKPELRSTFGQSEEKMIKQSLGAPAPKPETLREAERVVPRWIKKQQSQEQRLFVGISLGTVILGLLCLALLEFVGAGVFRCSPALTLFSIAVLNGAGQLATRWRLLWRWSIVWLPMGGLLFAALGLLEKSGTLALLGVMGSVLGVMALALVAGVLAYSILHPSCGVADRLAGTRLAPK